MSVILGFLDNLWGSMIATLSKIFPDGQGLDPFYKQTLLDIIDSVNTFNFVIPIKALMALAISTVLFEIGLMIIKVIVYAVNLTRGK